MGVDVPDVEAYNQAGARMRRDQLLIFSRWCQVMLRFEKALYEDPEQDLNRLWWDLAEKYQRLRRPENRDAPDYASKIHLVAAPAYYHNYMFGQLFACQLHRTIAREVLRTDDVRNAYYVENHEVGEFMRERVFAPGRRLSWNALTRHATGEPLGPAAFAAEFGEASR
jgi:peptidyl-dipeptidase A